MGRYEWSHLVETSETMEEKAGIRLKGLYAEIEEPASPEDQFEVTVMGEVESISGGPIESDIEIQVVIYNKKGQVIDVSTDMIFSDEFTGYEAFKISALTNVVPTRIRLALK